MLSKARRIVQPQLVTAFDLASAPVLDLDAAAPSRLPSPGTAFEGESAPQAATEPPDVVAAAAAADGFAKGFAQGERAGAEAAAQKTDALLQRLVATLDELSSVRAEMIRQTERQMVELSLVIARRVVQREVSMDADLLMAMARVALDRLADSASVTVRLHPDEFDVTMARRAQEWPAATVQVVADRSVPRGGCRVESDCGVIEAGIDAQMQEVARALLGDDYVSVRRNGTAA